MEAIPEPLVGAVDKEHFDERVRLVAIPATAGFLLFWLSMGSLPGNQAAQHDTNVLRQLRSQLAQERDQARLHLLSDRKQAIEFLLNLARSNGEDVHLSYAKLTAINLLGDYRAVEARELLIQEIEFSPASLVRDELHALNRYPAAKALVKVGNPALLAIMDRLGKPASDNELRIFAWVVYSIDGKEVGLYRLRDELAKTPAGLERKQENLMRLIEIYQGPRPDP